MAPLISEFANAVGNWLSTRCFISAVAGLLLAVAGTSFAAFPNGQLYPFDINTALRCRVENPIAGDEGQEDFIDEEFPRLPFEQVVRQRDHPDDIWLPGEVP